MARRVVGQPRYHQCITAEQQRPEANSDKTACFRQIEEAALRYASAGRPRTLHAIQKCCMPGERNGLKLATIAGNAIALLAEAQRKVLRRKRLFT
jgi:hypothetical protein